MEATIFKTGTKVLGSSVGIGKLIVNYAGGASEMVTFRATRKQLSEDEFKAVRLNVYNGHMLLWNDDNQEWVNADEFRPTTAHADVETDDDGNIIYRYQILSAISTQKTYTFRIGAGTTRLELFTDDVEEAGPYGSSSYPIEEGDFNFEQYAFTPFTEINCCYANRAYGSIDSLKHRTDISVLYVSGSSSLYGNIENLVASASSLTGLYVYNTKIQGSLNKLLEAMKAAGVRSVSGQDPRTLRVTFGSSGVTYNGVTMSGVLTFTFDESGNYTLNE